MIYVYGAILGFYLVLFLLSAGETGNPFRKMAARIYRSRQERGQNSNNKRRNWKRAFYTRQLGDKLKTLQPGIPVEQQIREHYLSLYETILLVVFVGDLLCAAVWAGAHGNARLVDGSLLYRRAFGEGDVEVDLLAEIPGIQEETFTCLVKERKLTQEELEKSLKRCKGPASRSHSG